MNNPTRTIISRRSRPAKEPLSKDIIVKTALALLKSEGSSGLSMRKIAKALDTGPSSLYVYVTNHQELSAYVLDAGMESVVLSNHEGVSWEIRLYETLHSYLTVLMEFPGVAELALNTIPIGPHSLALTEYILERLHEAGIHSTSAAWGLDLLMLYASSVAFEQASRDQNGTTLQAISASYRSLNVKQYPMIASLQSELITSDGEERFRWGLEVILQGILQRQK
ncbi:TetR/AcrR family transcriptional regulator [Paenibacillus alba]|uniref:TetR/AcrR family transcriptional regulator n=1 Tax=Paenibacillus alba TaxID=1197127 RepID=UPI00156706A2|nr:TetR/AcrR family transcriptional regulator [Paenibacillus alba]NQX66205.1 TetR/AcrR family transcriptional regulator [Paenibacillus alba]